MAVVFAMGLAGTLLFIAGVLHVPINGLTAAVALLVGCGYVGRALARPLPGRGGLKPALHAPALIPIVIILIAAIRFPLHDYDGRAFWMFKAKAIAHEHSIEVPFFREGVAPRNDYPLLMPLDAATVMLLTGSLDDTLPRFVYVAMYVAFVFMIASELGGWWAALLAWLPMFSVASEGGALSAYADVALAAFVGGAFFELVHAKRPWHFGAWVAFVLLTKREGLPLAIILLVAGVVVFRWKAAVIPIVAFLALAIWKSRIPAGDEENLVALLPTLKLNHLPTAILGFARHLVSPMWGLFWIAAIVALVLTKQKEAAFVIGAAFAVDILAYTVTTWIQFDLINSSADRLLMHVVAPALYAMSRTKLSPA